MKKGGKEEIKGEKGVGGEILREGKN